MNMINVCLFLIFFTKQVFIQHGSRLETWRSDLCQDEGLSTLACKSESLLNFNMEPRECLLNVM